jgi:hypothetical protein
MYHVYCNNTLPTHELNATNPMQGLIYIILTRLHNYFLRHLRLRPDISMSILMLMFMNISPVLFIFIMRLHTLRHAFMRFPAHNSLFDTAVLVDVFFQVERE